MRPPSSIAGHSALPEKIDRSHITSTNTSITGRAFSQWMHGIIYRAGLPIAIILAWQLIASLGLVSPALLPSPAYIAETFIYLIQSGELWRHVSSSAARVFQGYAIAATLALTLGIAMGAFPKIDRVMRLLVQILKPVPPIAWIPLAILWFGIDEGSKIFIIALGAFFPILVSTVDGIRQTDKKYVELARVLELPHHLFLTRVMLPSALPHVMTGLRLGFALAWMCVVAAELIAASSGIGFLIMDGRAVSQADLVLAGMLTLGVLGKLTDDGIQRLEKRLTGWRTDFTGLSAK